MKNTKKNNKGFSLVELIVVVLIMAIIAVALAPQVMRWVENSRKGNDAQLVDTVISALLISYTDKAVVTELGDTEVTVTVSSAGVAFSGLSTSTAIEGSMKKNLGVSALTDSSLQTKAADGTYTIKFKKGVVTERPNFDGTIS